MSKRKLLTLVTTLTLVAAVGVGATLAYFTDNTNTTNVFTMGNVDIELTEPGFDNDDGIKDNAISGVMPGQTIVKDPTITLAKDSLDAYIRVRLKVNGFEDLENGEQLAQDVIDGLDIIATDWEKVGDYYYYCSYNKPRLLTNKIPGHNSATLFTKVTIPTTWNNQLATRTFSIDVFAEAIQAENLAKDFFKDDGSWNISSEDIIEYVPQKTSTEKPAETPTQTE